MAKKMAKKYLHDELQKKGYLAPEKKETSWEKFMHKALFIIAIIGPALTLPQIWNVWVHKSVHGLSPYTWWGYVFVNLCWLSYGIVSKEKVLIFNYLFRFTVNLAVFLGIIIYR